METYIGLDVHAASCTAAVIDGRGKKLGSHVIATNGQALVSFLAAQPGRVHLCMEERTQGGWLYEILWRRRVAISTRTKTETRNFPIFRQRRRRRYICMRSTTRSARCGRRRARSSWRNRIGMLSPQQWERNAED